MKAVIFLIYASSFTEIDFYDDETLKRITRRHFKG